MTDPALDSGCASHPRGLAVLAALGLLCGCGDDPPSSQAPSTTTGIAPDTGDEDDDTTGDDCDGDTYCCAEGCLPDGESEGACIFLRRR